MEDTLKHILKSQQFSREWLEEEFFPLSTEMKNAIMSGKRLNDLDGKIVSLLFYEPSTRTRTSFQQAALKLGALTVATENAKEFSSAVKGETMKDTTRIMNAYHRSAQDKGTDLQTAIFKRRGFQPGHASIYRDWVLIAATEDQEIANISSVILRTAQDTSLNKGIAAEIIYRPHLNQIGVIYETGFYEVLLRFPLSPRSQVIDQTR